MTEPTPATDHRPFVTEEPTAPPVTLPPTAVAAPLLPVTHMYAGPGTGPVGKVRSTGVCILLSIVTLGIYTWVWYYQTHEEMKRHTGEGIGGALGLVIAFFAGIVSVFLSPAEVGRLYERRGQRAPVSAVTGLWAVLGALILVGPIVWFVKTNGALNAYWRSLGAQG
jgi:hypothetical protein